MTIKFEHGKVIFRKEEGKNMIYFFKDGRDYGRASDLPKNFGNYWFKVFKDASKRNDNLESTLDYFWLDWIAYNEDFDSYSDIYKDINNIRPHYTVDQWERIVKEAKSRKP